MDEDGEIVLSVVPSPNIRTERFILPDSGTLVQHEIIHTLTLAALGL